MAATIPLLARVDHLQAIKTQAALWKLVLWTNDDVPQVGWILGNITEAAYSGYARAALAFGAVNVNGADEAFMVAAQASFEHNGGGVGNLVYGWGVVDEDENRLLAAERLSAPKVMAEAGDKLLITLTMHLTQA